METKQLLTNITNDDAEDEEEEELNHPFVVSNMQNNSFFDSPNRNKILLLFVGFMICIIIGFLVAINNPFNPPSQINPVQLQYNLTTITSKPSPHIVNTVTDKPTVKPIDSPVNKPAIQATDKPIAKHATQSSYIDDSILFETQSLSTNPNLNDLEINIDLIKINENGLTMQQKGPYYGSYNFKYKYPINENDKYKPNEMHKICYNFKFKSTDNIQHKNINNVIINIEFTKFKLENGFDRVLIRHFNDSFIDLPKSYTGYKTNIIETYVLQRLSSKTICIEFQSDEDIVDKGIEYNVNIYYDLCVWSDWNECSTMSLVGIKWKRGPFMNGKCGLGITSKQRLTELINKPDSTDDNGFLMDCSANSNIPNEFGPEYCIKRKCFDWDNNNDPDFPPKRMPGQAWYNLSRYYNGEGRIDPYYSDPFRIYLSTENRYNLNTDYGNLWLNQLEENLIKKAKEISDEHHESNVLKYAIGDLKNRDKTMEYLGGKVLNSLINGIPFIVSLTGDSVTSGHDNMFMSTYSMQLQSRLRHFWVLNGNKGSAFLTRNIGVGGGVGSNSQGFLPMSLATETFPSLFSKLNDIINDNYDTWFRNGGYPIRKMDILLFEYMFTEGKGTKSSRELHLREAAYLNAIWGVIGAISGIEPRESCQDWSQLDKTMKTWSDWDRREKNKYAGGFYTNKMGVALIDSNFGMNSI